MSAYTTGLTHFGQLPHKRHDPVLLSEVLHREEVPATRLDSEFRVQRQVQLLWLFWLGPLFCLSGRSLPSLTFSFRLSEWIVQTPSEVLRQRCVARF